MIHFFKEIEDLTKDNIKGKKNLTYSNVEESITLAFQERKKIIKTLFENSHSLFLDLSQVQFSTLSSITYLVLQLDSICKKENITSVFVALPTIGNTINEINSNNPRYSEKNKNIDKLNRQKANSFLKNINFVGAVKQCLQYYEIEVYFTESFQFAAEFSIQSFDSTFEFIQEVKHPTEFGYHFLYPLEWITVGESKVDYMLIQNNFEKTLGNIERGLHPFDVKAIKNVIFYELQKNVIEHTFQESKPKRFLFSMGLLTTTSLDTKNKIESAFYEFVNNENVSSLVEIYFGDTGGGFFTKEYKEKSKIEGCATPSAQLKWSFNRWSSQKKDEVRRGTKGLYRILRVVNNYSGLVQINTNGFEGGFILGREWKFRNCLPLEGAFLQIKLCPYSVIKEFKFENRSSHLKIEWKTIALDITDDLGNIKIQIQKEFKSSEGKNYFFIIDIDKKKYRSEKFTIEIEPIITELLINISYNANPSGAVIYLNSKEDESTISNLINSANEFIKNKTAFGIAESPENEDIYDPVIVIFKSSVFWFGGDQSINRILDEVYDENFDKILYDLTEFKSLNQNIKDRVRQYLLNDNNLVFANNKGEIKLNFINLDFHFSKLFKNRNDELKKAAINYSYCSPKVEIVDNWINVKKLIEDNEHGFALSLYLKLLKEDQEEKIKLNGKLFLLIDHKQHLNLASSISRLFDIPENRIVNIQEQIQIKSLKRFKLFPEKSNIIILTSLIGTSETIRRLVKYVRRDNAIPIAILCLGNFRKNKITTLQTWETNTPIISIYQENEVELEELVKDREYFQYKNQQLLEFKGKIIQPDYSFPGLPEKQLISDDLLNLLKNSKSLHYSHIGIKNDRHFTFYVNKSNILKDKSFLWDKLQDEILNWKSNKNITHFTIYIKRDLISKSSDYFLNYLKNLCNSNLEIYDNPPQITGTKSNNSLVLENPNIFHTPEKSNIFLIDFGVISGDSINKIINNVYNVENFYFCILFNQSDSEKVQYYTRIATLTDKEYNNKIDLPINITIKFLLSLPLNYYSIDNCPICNHIEALDTYKMSDNSEDYMFNFSEDRQERLSLINKEDIENQNYPFDFYYKERELKRYDNHELSSEIIQRMFFIKILLENSLINTSSRIKLFNLIFNSYFDKECESTNCNSNLYALLYLLSFEVHWFQKDPLIFRDFRIMLSEIALFIAQYNYTDLKQIFEKEKKYKSTPIGCVTRYKYAAISVLRSTDKLKFCENVYKIISNSKNQDHYSDNLIQNVFYHTFSILKNKYNKSEKYFRELLKSYNDIKNLPELSEGQKQTSSKLYFLQYSKLTEIEIDDFDDIALIKRVKDFIDESYAGNNHPQLEENITDLSLEFISKDGLEELRINRENSIRYSLLSTPFLDYSLKWLEVQRYLYKKIIPVYTKLSDSVKNSTTFKDEYQLLKTFDRIGTNNSSSILHNFSQLLNRLSSKPLIYLDIKREYDDTVNFILERLIKRNSDLITFLDQFPLNIYEVLLNKKLNSKFPNLNIKKNTDSLVFYPTSRFKKDLDLIINSIHRRLTPQFQNDDYKNLNIFTDVILNIELYDDIENVNLHISYNGTSSEKHEHTKYQKGGLESIQNEIKNYGGDLFFERKNDLNGFFYIKYKFLKYE